MLSVTTDYVDGKGCALPYLKQIAEVGFTHIHWCHEWNTDYLYGDEEVGRIRAWLKDLALRATDLHGSSGVERCWMAPDDEARRGGIELVCNRIRMIAGLGADVVIMHIPEQPHDPDEARAFWDRVHRTLDAVENAARGLGVRIALENGHFPTIERALLAYPPDFLGLCYDSGHGNLIPDGLDRLQGLKDRLIAVHLHDNDGSGDRHKPPFSGSVDWSRLTRILAASPYRKPVNLEVSVANAGFESTQEFLVHTRHTGERLTEMIETERDRLHLTHDEGSAA